MEMNLKYSFKLLTSHFLLLTFAIFLLTSLTTKATVRYVSKSGSNEYPYTSGSTAAWKIQDCIDISFSGDTIYVANGVYEEQVVMIAGLSLIGSGTDSCIIDTRKFSEPRAVGVNRNCLLRGFKIIVQNSSQSSGQGIGIGGSNSIIEFNEVINARIPGIYCYDTNSIIRHNRILSCYRAILTEFNQPKIDSNYIFLNDLGGTGIDADLYSYPLIRGNIIVITDSHPSHGIDGYWSTFNYGASIIGNLFFSISSETAIESNQQESIINNAIYGNHNRGITVDFTALIINNSITNGKIGIRKYSQNNPTIKYNNVWGNNQDYVNFTPDSTNISVNPMYVNPDSQDLHLQKYSPLIDAGDPTILDKDGTRSDIGLYGGPFGESYVYLDLSPRPPVNLSAVYDSTSIVLNWNKNTEADFSHYLIYRDVNQDFTADSTKLIAETSDTSYADMISSETDKLFYKLRAVDYQGNQSAPSEEIFINLTSVTTNDLMTINDYRLYQNYPNPFNPSTKIGYRLKERGYVKLYVYDVKGELVSVLVNQIQEAGYYEAEFSPAGMGNQESGIESLASGIYICQIMVRGEGDIPVFTDMKKMIFLK
jgi:hypothetical protein